MDLNLNHLAVRHAASKSQEPMMGVHIEPDTGRATSTNGHMLITYAPSETPGAEALPMQPFTLPTDQASKVSEALKGTDVAEIKGELKNSSESVQVSVGGMDLTAAKVVEGFPNYRQVCKFDGEPKVSLHLNLRLLERLIKGLKETDRGCKSKFNSEPSNCIVRIDVWDELSAIRFTRNHDDNEGTTTAIIMPIQHKTEIDLI